MGSRLAFDAEKGRLWAICPKCRRWSLSPLEERWEALEGCERLFRGARRKFSTAQIGLATLPSGLQLVRIGTPLRSEFVGWRYGPRLRQRRISAQAGLGLAAGVVGGVISLSVISPITLFLAYGAAALTYSGWILAQEGKGEHASLPPFRRPEIVIQRAPLFYLDRTFLRVEPSAPDGWALEVGRPQGPAFLTGRDAVQFLRFVLPGINGLGGSKRGVQQAVKELESVGGPNAYFAEAELRARKYRSGHQPLGGMPAPVRLALEIAANEETEQAALAAELALLHQTWKEAEETAAIADQLLLPSHIEARLRHLKEPDRRSGRA